VLSLLVALVAFYVVVVSIFNCKPINRLE